MTARAHGSRAKAVVSGVVVAILGTIAVAGVRQGLAPMLGSDMALSFFLIVVTAAAAVGGLGAGLFAMAIALMISTQTFIGLDQLIASPAEWVRVVAFLVEGATISVLFTLLQGRTARLSTALADLGEQRTLIERLALEDTLTGIGNRRALDRDLATHVALAQRGLSKLTVISADVDGLKWMNDQFGHVRGDELLVAVAELLVKSCRASDVAYRVGGDEFVILLPNTGRLDYAGWNERFERLSAEMLSAFEGVGVSIGASHLPLDGETPDALLNVADKRMYAAKIANAHPRVVTRGLTNPKPVVPAHVRTDPVPTGRAYAETSVDRGPAIHVRVDAHAERVSV